MEVVISNSALNSYGFRVLTEGIDAAQYRRNPVLLWGHHRSHRGTTDEVLPIGRVENLRIDGDNLVGTPVFDDNDEFAVRIKNKFENGFLNMVSPGLDVVETDASLAATIPGQRRATITKSKLREVSVVDIGSNDDALILYADGVRITLSADGDIPAVPAVTFKNDLNDTENMKTIALKLGLPETASETEILAKLGDVQAGAAQALELRAELDAQIDAAILAEVESAVADRRITADKKAHFLALGKTVGPESLRATLGFISPALKPTDVIARARAGSAAAEYKTLGDVPATERIRLRAEEPERYARLYEAEYGIKFHNS